MADCNFECTYGSGAEHDCPDIDCMHCPFFMDCESCTKSDECDCVHTAAPFSNDGCKYCKKGDEQEV